MQAETQRVLVCKRHTFDVIISQTAAAQTHTEQIHFYLIIGDVDFGYGSVQWRFGGLLLLSPVSWFGVVDASWLDVGALLSIFYE